MTAWLIVLVSMGTSFLGSFASLIVWFHFDIEGRYQHRMAEHKRRKDHHP